MVVARRALLACTAAAISFVSERPATAISLRELAEPENAVTKFIDGDELRENDQAPALAAVCQTVNAPSASMSLSDFTRTGQYVLLCFIPEPGSLADRSNSLQLSRFQTMKDEYDGLDTVIVACSKAPVQQLARIANADKLTFPLLSDPKGALVDAYGARSLTGGTNRQVFVIDTSGRLRYIERNIDLGVGEVRDAHTHPQVRRLHASVDSLRVTCRQFSIEACARLTARKLFQIHNTDGWAV